eukprot:CAMPEP_0204374638 /NCGR_PEP_ID=MMETSP0469-20131031/48753_1 /ASSEMBLY_ACC=CAM_ASM_000384 /TAXON_ID=2969 /ORGANISM="Oxyrrhis marina" /LENGTH=540 /DNA_ID=CAMNT_0051365229 /DNA_START=18 /DNA_END=1640 /DNA_ORIENTATION=-
MGEIHYGREQPACRWHQDQCPTVALGCAVALLSMMWLLKTLQKCRLRLLGRLLVNITVSEIMLECFRLLQFVADTYGWCSGWYPAVSGASNSAETIGYFGYASVASWEALVALSLVLCFLRTSTALKVMENWLGYFWLFPMLVIATALWVVSDPDQSRERSYRYVVVAGMVLCMALVLVMLVALQVYRVTRWNYLTTYSKRVTSYVRFLLVGFVLGTGPRVCFIVASCRYGAAWFGTWDFTGWSVCTSCAALVNPLCIALITRRIDVCGLLHHGKNDSFSVTKTVSRSFSSPVRRKARQPESRRVTIQTEVDETEPTAPYFPFPANAELVAALTSEGTSADLDEQEQALINGNDGHDSDDEPSLRSDVSDVGSSASSLLDPDAFVATSAKESEDASVRMLNGLSLAAQPQLAYAPTQYSLGAYHADQTIMSDIAGTPEGDRQALFLAVAGIFPSRRKTLMLRTLTDELDQEAEGTYASRYFASWGRTTSGSELVHISGPHRTLVGHGFGHFAHLIAALVVVFFLVAVTSSSQRNLALLGS